MPIIFSYDVTDAPNIDRNRIQSMFERFGWERIGGSCYRFPKLSATSSREDWMNRVIPALMCFRAYAKKRNLALSKFSLDAHVSTGSQSGRLRDGQNIKLRSPNNVAFGAKNLRDWIDDVATNIPY